VGTRIAHSSDGVTPARYVSREERGWALSRIGVVLEEPLPVTSCAQDVYVRSQKWTTTIVTVRVVAGCAIYGIVIVSATPNGDATVPRVRQSGARINMGRRQRLHDRDAIFRTHDIAVAVDVIDEVI
jgi:hypothetical protein